MRHLLEVEGLSKRFGALVATDNVSLTLAEGETHALIGPNGAGKSTLIAQLTGEMTPDTGRIAFDGRNVTALPAHERARLGLARSFQITCLFNAFTSLGNVALATQAREPHSFRFWKKALCLPQLVEPARAQLANVGLGERAHVEAGDLSHGEHRQLELAMALATEPRLLLLDEPMAGLGTEESREMAALLAKLKGRFTILLVEHDMDIVFALADRISVLVRGRIVATGSPTEIRADPHVRRAYLGDDFDMELETVDHASR